MKGLHQPSAPRRVHLIGATLAELGPKYVRLGIPEPLAMVVGAPRPGGLGLPPGSQSYPYEPRPAGTDARRNRRCDERPLTGT
jgi:hypothetical protein